VVAQTSSSSPPCFPSALALLFPSLSLTTNVLRHNGPYVTHLPLAPSTGSFKALG
jgi:hypothetical protein